MADPADRVKTAATWVYITDWWDGPLSGVVLLVTGERAWAVVGEKLEDRVFSVYRMPESFWAAQDKRHALWLECCGNYSFDKPPGWRPTRPIEDFYKAYPSSTRKVETGNLLFELGIDQIEFPVDDHAMYVGAPCPE